MDSTSNSSEQSESHRPFEKPRGPVGFHPVCEPRSERVETSSPGSSSPLLWDSDSGASLDFEDEDVSRINNVAWCVCGHCIPMTTHRVGMLSGDNCRATPYPRPISSLHDGPRRLRSRVHQQGSVSVRSRPDVDVRFACRLVGSANS